MGSYVAIKESTRLGSTRAHKNISVDRKDVEKLRRDWLDPLENVPRAPKDLAQRFRWGGEPDVTHPTTKSMSQSKRDVDSEYGDYEFFSLFYQWSEVDAHLCLTLWTAPPVDLPPPSLNSFKSTNEMIFRMHSLEKLDVMSFDTC
ncbi:hypothetical protein BHM03_00041562 [Ensete ventricosum]|nr:hypothetical protein BHM03_00041562 [Ensete ventricosum]